MEKLRACAGSLGCDAVVVLGATRTSPTMHGHYSREGLLGTCIQYTGPRPDKVARQ